LSEVVNALIRLSGVRGLIARKMHESLQQSAQLSFCCDCDASEIIRARAAWKAQGIAIGYEDIIAYNLVRVLVDFTTFNALETDEGIELQQAVHVACAVGLETGLVAPAIFDTQSKSLPEIAAARRDLVDRARRGKLTVKEMTGGTITISNLGLTRVDYFTPILNRPQQAIFGFGRVRRQPVVAEDGKIVAGDVMGVSLTVDHRVHDGASAGAFLTALVERLERPQDDLGES
jgi:pyruvate dehydrogenase E2 component (dihydrolipoamide acetyltransferase)